MANSLKNLLTPLVPPILISGYRRGRYGSALRDQELADQRAREAQLVLPSRTLPELFPGIETQSVNVPATEIVRPRDMVVPLPELLTLGAICRYLQPRRIFEIGTYTRSSTLLMAMNPPEATELTTIDYETTEHVGSAFRGAAHASKIKQLHGDSRAFDFSPYYQNIDLILVAANHTYQFVKVDSETAFKLLKPGGVVSLGG